MRVRFSSPFGVVDYSQDCMTKKNVPEISWPMAVFRCVFVCLYTWRNSLDGIAFLCFVVGSRVLEPHELSL